MREHINTLRSPCASTEAKIHASALLWSEAHRALKEVKAFKESLTGIVEEGVSTTLQGASGSSAEVIAIPPTPILEGYGKEDLVAVLGEDIYEKYISESRTLRFSLYRIAPMEVRDLFSSLETAPSKHQVKFHK